MGCLAFLKDFFLGFWDYETPKVMVVKDRKLGVIYRAVQFLVLTYFVWYVFISQKSYQDTETRPESSVYTEMRGVAMLGDSVQDTTEYVRPSEGFDIISTILRREVTHDQMQGTCAEHYSVANANCTKDSDCTQGDIDFDGHGQRTGRCIPYYNYTFKTCEIKTWCPIEEYAAVSEPALEKAINFTVLIQNAILFPKFKVLRSNIKPKKRKKLSRCHYHPDTNPYCPVFRLGFIAAQAQEKFSELCITGGIIGVFINWKCDFDKDPSECIPTYSFRRMDIRKNLTSSEYYYRFAKYYHKDGVEYRTLIKAYGMRLDVIVQGYAGKFSLIPTIINAVMALTSVGICSIICDWIMLTFIDRNEVFSEMKFDDVSKNPNQPITTDLTLTSYGSTHSDLSDGVPL
ncbi:P2X purinoceptor 2-like [Carassius carassius]|uniref:P2X purinoceptor 2-like n=1 Tax=Carassius carassius TaxID=217509 RepID=UPI002868D963|nr:P2X purinoceptor 2-like [Carassius carassius]